MTASQSIVKWTPENYWRRGCRFPASGTRILISEAYAARSATCLDGSVNPNWRHNLRLTWESSRHLQVSAQWRFIGRAHFDNNSPQILLANQEEGFFDPFLQRIPNYSYLDLTAVWAVGPRLQVRVGCNNVFDKDPPFLPLEISGRGGNLNTFPTYDILGRNIFIALRATL